ncbi:hypothetical protein [Uliginosibacterium sp. TH139]|uniref:hypothetical protein n=1 Tax=Uliginosibacterium sp. TH139 TaxID=2067453 RepID=UPI0011804DC2|nr:hypothetical protein [Uliginosibacterium sp. TH139]
MNFGTAALCAKCGLTLSSFESQRPALSTFDFITDNRLFRSISVSLCLAALASQGFALATKNPGAPTIVFFFLTVFVAFVLSWPQAVSRRIRVGKTAAWLSFAGYSLFFLAIGMFSAAVGGGANPLGAAMFGASIFLLGDIALLIALISILWESLLPLHDGDHEKSA